MDGQEEGQQHDNSGNSHNIDEPGAEQQSKMFQDQGFGNEGEYVGDGQFEGEGEYAGEEGEMGMGMDEEMVMDGEMGMEGEEAEYGEDFEGEDVEYEEGEEDIEDEGFSHEYNREDGQSGTNSQINQSGQQDESGQGQDRSGLQQDDHSDDKSYANRNNRDGDFSGEEIDDTSLPPERKVRYKLFKFINKMRQTYHIGDYSLDRIANKLAMEYANFLLNNKESDEELKSLSKKFNMTGEFKASSFEAFVDSDKANKSPTLKYTDYLTDFYDVHATLIEFEQHRDNILSPDFNSVGIGLAYNEMKVVVVDIFCLREVIVDRCIINERNGTIQINGKIINDQYGVYALRVIRSEEPTRDLIKVTPQNIVPFNRENKVREFTATFSDGAKIFGDMEQKLIEVFMRVKPESIPYGKAFTSKIIFDQLVFGARVPLENFPSDVQIQEQRHQDENDENGEEEEKRILADFEVAKKEEKIRRIKLDSELYGREDQDKLNNILEEANEDDSMSENGSRIEGGKKKNDSKNDSKMTDPIDDNSNREKSEHYEQELNNLKECINKLKEENEKIQKKIKAIYIIKKEEGREERNFFKESNINESTYADSLSSTAALYNDLNLHKTKLDQDLKRYQESIKDQEKRKEDVYTILMEYKNGLLENAETRKGTMLPRQQIDIWLSTEKNLENDIRNLRIESFTKSLEMNRLKKELKKMEDYFEGLHIIDFEQLKIENNTLTEKIEDRNEEIHKLKNKINYTVQILAHLQEKYKDISSENDIKKGDCQDMKEKIYEMKRGLTKNKELNDHKTLKQLNENKKIDQINSIPLKNYYKNTLKKINDLGRDIESVSKQLALYRKRRGGNVKDIKLLIMRKERMMKEYKTLPHIDSDEKTK